MKNIVFILLVFSFLHSLSFERYDSNFYHANHLSTYQSAYSPSEVIGSLLIDNPGIFVYLKWAGISYILYLAYETLTLKIKSVDKGKFYHKGVFSFYRDGFLVAGLSPKALVFFSTVFIQFINFNENVFAQFLILTITWVSLDFISLMMYGLAAGKIANWLKGNPRILNTISACVLIIIAIIVAIRT